MSVGYNIRKYGKPTFLYTHNHHIEQLDNIIHSPSGVSLLNEQGLDFYLNEPLCPRLVSQASYFDNIIKETDTDIFFDELDSIKNYIQRNNLTNVTVYVGDYNIEKYSKNYEKYMRLVTKDIFFYSKHYTEVPKPMLCDKFDYKFINLNSRYTLYRHVIASYIKNKQVLLSWFFEGLPPIKTEWYDFTDFDNNFMLEEIGLRTLDQKNAIISNPTDTYPLVEVNQRSGELEEYYANSFCDLVAESRFTRPMGNISEKTLRPILYRKPFILIAPPKTLEFIKSLGFKTFDEFWDESYDDEFDHDTRLKKILEVIEYIDGMSIMDLRKLYNNMKSIVEHNFEVLDKTITIGKMPKFK